MLAVREGPRRYVECETPTPQCIRCERNILGALLIDDDAFQAAAELTPGDFCMREHATVFSAFLEIRESGGGFDLPIIVDHLNSTGRLEAAGGPNYVASLVDGMPVRYKIEQEIRRELETSARRELANLGDALFREASAGILEPRELLALHQKSVDSFSARFRNGIGAETNRRFSTARELFAAKSDPTQWIVPGIAAAGTVSVLSGKVKLAGKTTFALAAAAAVVGGRAFLDAQTTTTPVVYLTEQSRSSFREAIDRAKLTDSDLLSVIFWHEVYQ